MHSKPATPTGFSYVLFMTAIILISAVGFVASDIYLPALPSIALYFHKSSLQVQLTMTVFLLSMALSQVAIGALSDRWGRKKILGLTILIFIFSSAGCYLSTTLNELIFFRFWNGIGAACGLSIGYAIVADVYDVQNAARSLSIAIPLVAFSPAVAPIVGGYIDEHSDWRYIFLSLVGYGIFILLLLLTPVIPKLSRPVKTLSNQSDTALKRILKDKKFLGYALCMMNSNASYFSFLAISPFLLRSFGYSATQVGYAFCLSSFPYIGASFLGRRLSFNFTNLQLIALGLFFNLMGALCMVGFAYSHWAHMASILVPVFIITIGNGFLMPFSFSPICVMSSRDIDPTRTSALSGLNGKSCVSKL